MFFEERLISQNAEAGPKSGSTGASKAEIVDTNTALNAAALDQRVKALTEELEKGNASFQEMEAEYLKEKTNIDDETKRQTEKYTNENRPKIEQEFNSSDRVVFVNATMVEDLNSKNSEAAQILDDWLNGNTVNNGKVKVEDAWKLANALGATDNEETVTVETVRMAVNKLKEDTITRLIDQKLQTGIDVLPKNLNRSEEGFKKAQAAFEKAKTDLGAAHQAREQYDRMEKRSDGKQEVAELKGGIKDRNTAVAELDLKISSLTIAYKSIKSDYDEAKDNHEKAEVDIKTALDAEKKAYIEANRPTFEQYYNGTQGKAAVEKDMVKACEDKVSGSGDLMSKWLNNREEVSQNEELVQKLAKALGLDVVAGNLRVVALIDKAIGENKKAVIEKLVQDTVDKGIADDVEKPAKNKLNVLKAVYEKAKILKEAFIRKKVALEASKAKEIASKKEDYAKLAELEEQLELEPSVQASTDPDGKNAKEQARIAAVWHEEPIPVKKTVFEKMMDNAGYVAGKVRDILVKNAKKEDLDKIEKGKNVVVGFGKNVSEIAEGTRDVYVSAGTAVKKLAGVKDEDKKDVAKPADKVEPRKQESLSYEVEAMDGYNHLPVKDPSGLFDGVYLPKDAIVMQAGTDIPGVGKVTDGLGKDMRVVQLGSQFMLLSLKDGSYTLFPLNANGASLADKIVISVGGKPLKIDESMRAAAPRALSFYNSAKNWSGDVKREVDIKADGDLIRYLGKRCPSFVKVYVPEASENPEAVKALTDAGFTDVTFRGLDDDGRPTYDFVLDDGRQGNAKILEEVNGMVAFGCVVEECKCGFATRATTLAESAKGVMERIKAYKA